MTHGHREWIHPPSICDAFQSVGAFASLFPNHLHANVIITHRPQFPVARAPCLFQDPFAYSEKFEGSMPGHPQYQILQRAMEGMSPYTS